MKRWIENIIILVATLGMIITGLFFCVQYWKHKVAEDTIEKVVENVVKEESDYFDIDWKEAKKKFPQLVGWIYIPSLDISQPVVQGVTNELYLYHSADMQWNELGAIFMDFENKPDLSDNNTIIYGHSVEFLGGMFTDIGKLQDKKEFDKCKYWYYLTPEQNYKISTYCFAVTDEDQIYYDMDWLHETTYHWDEEAGHQVPEIKDRKKMDVLSRFKKESNYSNDIKVTDKSRMMTLSTCNVAKGLYSSERFVLVGRINKLDGKVPKEG